MSVFKLNNENGEWEKVIPEPYCHSFIPWLWKRITGYKDQYGRKAYLLPFREW